MEKTKKEIVIIGLILLMVIALIGVSYAAFRFTGEGTKVNSITTGSITMTYEETDNTISLNGALPTTDATGKKRLTEGEYFDFTVSSKIAGDVNINYEISAKDVTTSDRKIDGSNIKLYLTRLTDDGEEELMTPEVYNEETNANNFTGRPSGEMSLYTSSMNSSESNRYRIRMWVDEDYNPQGDGGNLQFSVQINVYGLDGNPEDLLPTVSEKLLASNLGDGSTYDDGVDTFITGEDPNNYIWYSGKLWRAVSVNNEAKTTKLVTQWNISAITYNPSNQTNFEGSYMEDWLNDTSVDGFLGNLRDYENFVVTDAVWDATLDATSLGSITRPNGTTTVSKAVGLLNIYEYQSSNNGEKNGYLNNGLNWWTLTPNSSSVVRVVYYNGDASSSTPTYSNGVRPSINLKSSVLIVDGNGTIDNPYRLEGDNDTSLSGTLLSSRYSGEYVRFGHDENNLYRIVSHETSGLTKITSAEPLKNSGTFITSAFGSSNSEVNYSTNSVIGTFLNGEYLTNYVGNAYSDMIEDSTTWYLGTVGSSDSYKLAKYTDTNMSSTVSTTTNAKVGLLRMGELMAGQFDRYGNNTSYWTLTPYSKYIVRYVTIYGGANYGAPTRSNGVRPSINLKSNVQITSGTGVKSDPFVISLGS
ncbi:MAG TPA: hypothetical protein IAB38_04975 [Candidatus Onthousia excrementipullorum]|uniref:DUF6273 domain-containing protein n=1 Tax=Candidatus Onthousia excrementipullorum TaxID=2840884 RepID=A0A9D1DUK5_9FIRM|nr:hypothetical protein [Candidatus Onthousia excrementipullorum]